MWCVASVFLAVGLLTMAVYFDQTERFVDYKMWAITIGLLCTFFGAGIGFYGIFRLMAQDDRILMLRTDGLFFLDNDRLELISWQQLENVTWEDRGLNVFEEGGRTVRISARFIGISGPNLVLRIKDVQRKALLGVL